MSDRGIEDGVHAADLHGDEADRAGKEPGRLEIGVGVPEDPIGRYRDIGEVDHMASRGTHAHRPPPGAIDRKAGERHHDHHPPCGLTDGDDRVRQAVDAGGIGLGTPQTPAVEAQRIVRLVGVPDAEDAPSRASASKRARWAGVP